MPIATENGQPITGLVRGNFILNERATTASVADRAHKAYPVLDPNSAENVMTVRDDPTAKGQVDPARALALRRRRHGRARRRLRARPHLRRRLSHRRSARRRLRPVRHARSDQLPEVRHVGGQPDAGPALRDRLGRVAERPLPAPLPLSGLQRGRAGPPGVRRRVRSGRRRRPRIVQPPLRPGVARRAAVLQHPLSGRSVSVHRRPVDRSGDRRDRQPARARRAHRHRAEGLPPADELRVLQPRRLARAHRSDRARRTPICRRTRAST